MLSPLIFGLPSHVWPPILTWETRPNVKRIIWGQIQSLETEICVIFANSQNCKKVVKECLENIDRRYRAEKQSIKVCPKWTSRPDPHRKWPNVRSRAGLDQRPVKRSSPNVRAPEEPQSWAFPYSIWSIVNKMKKSLITLSHLDCIFLCLELFPARTFRDLQKFAVNTLAA